LSDPRAALQEWVRVTRPGGSVNLAVFAPQAFQPQAGLLQQRVAGLAGGSSAILPWAHLAQADTLRILLEEAGLVDVHVHPEQLGYHSE
jgi:ubiquinone/menaquinone biosynthesis C-methylase UbiE